MNNEHHKVEEDVLCGVDQEERRRIKVKLSQKHCRVSQSVSQSEVFRPQRPELESLATSVKMKSFEVYPKTTD